jgi:hypothetical protein
MNDRISHALGQIHPSHPILDFLTQREIFQITPACKAIMASTAYSRFHFTNQRLSALAARLHVHSEEKSEYAEASPPIKLSPGAQFQRLIQTIEQPWLNEIRDHVRIQVGNIPEDTHLLLKPTYLRNFFSEALRSEANRLSRLLGRRLLLALNSNAPNNEAKAQNLITAGADLNFKNNPAVTVALEKRQFSILENILADADTVITRFNATEKDTESLFKAALEALTYLIELPVGETETATTLSNNMVTTFISLFQRGLSNTILCQLLMLRYNGTSFLHWVAKNNKYALHTLLDFIANVMANENDAENIFALFLLEDNDQWTAEHVITYYQNSNLTKKYLSLLNNMLEKKLPPTKLMTLLAIENDLKFNIGHLITQHRSPETNKIFLQLLMTLLSQIEEEIEHDDHNDIAISIYHFLISRNRDKNTIGHILSGGDSKVLLIFLTLLRKLQTTHPHQVLAILGINDREKSIFGHKIPSLHPEYIVEAYLEIIDTLLQTEHTTRGIYELASQQTDDQWNLGHAISHFATHQNRLHYLHILVKLLDSDIPRNDILHLFDIKSDEEQSICHYIALSDDNLSARMFLSFLKILLTENIPSPTLFPLLAQFDKEKTVSHYFFERLNSHSCLILLNLLERLRKKNPTDVSENLLLNLLTDTTRDEQQNCGIIIAIWQIEVVTYYLSLLSKLASNSYNKEKIFRILQQQDKQGLTFGSYLGRHDDIKLIRQYLVLIHKLSDSITPNQADALSKQVVIVRGPNNQNALGVLGHHELAQIRQDAEFLSDQELRDELTPQRFYTEHDLKISLDRLLSEFNLNSHDTQIINSALLSVFNISPMPKNYMLTHQSQSPFGYPYVIRMELEYADNQVDHFRAPSQAKIHYNPTVYKALYFDIEYFIDTVLAKEGPLTQYLRQLESTQPMLFARYQTQSMHETLPSWNEIRKNLYPILGDAGPLLFRKTNLFYYVLMRAFHIKETLTNGYTYSPSNTISTYHDSTIVFRLGITRKAATKLVDNMNSEFGNESASISDTAGTFFNQYSMFDIAVSKKLLGASAFIHLLKFTYQNLLLSSELDVQDYLDSQFIEAGILPKSCQELALALAEFDAFHIPKTTNKNAMKILVNLIIELREALEQTVHDANKLHTLASKIHTETQTSTLITKFGIINEARKQFAPVLETTTALRKRF